MIISNGHCDTSLPLIAACFLNIGGIGKSPRILLLKNLQSGLWELPAGKRENGEAVTTTLQRELREKTGIVIATSDLAIGSLGMLCIKHDSVCFLFRAFHLDFIVVPEVVINPAQHESFCWVETDEALRMPLVEDLEGCIHRYERVI